MRRHREQRVGSSSQRTKLLDFFFFVVWFIDNLINPMNFGLVFWSSGVGCTHLQVATNFLFFLLPMHSLGDHNPLAIIHLPTRGSNIFWHWWFTRKLTLYWYVKTCFRSGIHAMLCVGLSAVALAADYFLQIVTLYPSIQIFGISFVSDFCPIPLHSGLCHIPCPS